MYNSTWPDSCKYVFYKNKDSCKFEEITSKHSLSNDDMQRVYKTKCYLIFLSQVRRVLKPRQHYKLSWLPKNQWSWYKNKVACLDDKRKAKLMLLRLYKTMQLYAITFYQLLHFHPNSFHTSTTNVTLIRNEIVNRTHIWSHIVSWRISNIICANNVNINWDLHFYRLNLNQMNHSASIRYRFMNNHVTSIYVHEASYH